MTKDDKTTLRTIAADLASIYDRLEDLVSRLQDGLDQAVEDEASEATQGKIQEEIDAVESLIGSIENAQQEAEELI